MNQLWALIKKFWHQIFILLSIGFILLMAVIEINDKQQQAHQQQEMSSGKLVKTSANRNGILVLCYHRILAGDGTGEKLALTISNNEQLKEYSVTANQLSHQINYLRKKHVQIISLPQAIQLIRQKTPLKHKYVVFTFDDIDTTIYANAWPVLKRLKVPFTNFIITGNTNRYDNGTKLASWSQIETMGKSRQINFGIHTNNMHYLVENRPMLSYEENYPQFTKDFNKSEKLLKQHLGYQSRYFAYPYGSGTLSEQKFFANHQIISFSLEIGIINSQQNLATPLPRTMVDQNSWKNVVENWVK